MMNISLKTHSLNKALASVGLICGCALTNGVLAQSNYASFELVRENNFAPLITEDLNGDGAKDIIVSNYDPNIGRELLVYHQQQNGSFSATPQRIEIKTEIIAVGFADLRLDPGMELILYASAGLFSLSSAQEGYAGNLKPLLSFDLIATIPNMEQVQFITDIRDINGDGHIDLLLPGDDEYGIFYGRGDEQFDLVARFSTVNDELARLRSSPDDELEASITIDAESGILLELSATAPSPFADFIEQWDGSESNDDRLLRSEQWMPSASLANLNDDERLDIAYINVADDGLGQLNIHFQDNTGGFSPSPDWQASLDTSGYLELVDMNRDGQLDLYHLSGNGNDRDVRLFLNQGGSFDFAHANQILRFSGYEIRASFIDIPSQSGPVLNVSYYTIPVVDAIRNASLNRTLLLYGSDQVESGQVFNRRPDSRFDESFSAANVRGLSEQMSLDHDVDGDASNDALYINDRGMLAAKSINAELEIADEPFWEYVSPRTVFEFEVEHLNGDNKPDLILRHAAATTILVATP